MSKQLVIVTLGTFAFVFGMFSIVMGYLQADEPLLDVPEVKHDAACQINEHKGKK
jgi:hypothetical protein